MMHKTKTMVIMAFTTNSCSPGLEVIKRISYSTQLSTKEVLTIRRIFSLDDMITNTKGSLTLAMGKCLWFSVKIKVCQSSLSSP